jgi:hypothetical protein
MELTFYRRAGRCFVSDQANLPLEKAEKPSGEEPLIWLFSRDPRHGRASFCVSDARQLAARQEDIHFLDPGRLPEVFPFPPRRLIQRIDARILPAVNFQHPRWDQITGRALSSREGRVRVNLLAAGDVGSTLLMGLKLLGGDCISSIGVCDLNEKAVARWTAELGQVSWPWDYDALPPVEPVDQAHLFDCDIFVFTATKGVPPVGSGVKDVRMAQLEANRAIVETYAKKARQAQFRGLFCVMSDPVDPLCKAACTASNTADSGEWDGLGLLPEQIQGFGLGVMNARAACLAKQNPVYRSFLGDGRTFGPHGEGLVVANSVKNYDDATSAALTHEVTEANLRIRELGFKPYVAPALSSGAMQLLLLIRGHWHCSSVPLGDIWFGCRNRMTGTGVETENLSMPDALFHRLLKTESALRDIL